MAVSAKTQKRLARWRKDGIVFYSLMMLFPVAQFAIFYIGVNFNSFLMAFQEIDIAEDTVTWTFQNFRQILRIDRRIIDDKCMRDHLTAVIGIIAHTPQADAPLLQLILDNAVLFLCINM